MNFSFLRIDKWRRLILAFFDAFCFCFVSFFVFIVSTYIDCTLVVGADRFWINILILAICTLSARIASGVYTNLWRYTNTANYLKMILADGIGCVLALLISRIIEVWYIGIWLIVSIETLFALLTITARFVYRIIYKFMQNPTNDQHKIKVAIVGAGQTGAHLAEELTCNQRSNYKPVFFIDTDRNKIGNRVVGLRVYGQSKELLDVISAGGVSEIFIAISHMSNETAKELYDFYSQTPCKIKIYDVPLSEVGQYNDMLKTAKGRIREFKIEDLLFRQTINIKDSAVSGYYKDKVVLVTGGGGSIGSEICRQIAQCEPRQLVILDIYENNAYDIQQELLRKYGNRLNFAVEIASVRDRERLDCIFAAYRPDVVFHAAAHKHVPLMEHSSCEAIKNNVFGTYNAADAAEKYGVEKFILISTDKAVNPTNVMGASKRLCEMIVQSRVDSKTRFAAVRFGNVLGSNGSVIPLFKRQIENGGPVTITDKRIIRYFMTIPEASQLVVQAGAMANQGELFVLDMGKPVKIYDLAVNMIKMSGLEPGVDIEIKEVGLRPGEKLYEELLMKNEELDKTENDLIFIEKDTPLSRREVDEKLACLSDVLAQTKTELSSPKIKEIMRKIVPTFHDPEEINRDAKQSMEMKMVKF